MGVSMYPYVPGCILGIYMLVFYCQFIRRDIHLNERNQAQCPDEKGPVQI